MSTRVAIIGAGYAGLAAAIELTRKGIDVCVFESSRVMGGRARIVEKDGYRLDNGQHILLGAYSETLKLLRFLRVNPQSLLSLPFSLHVPGRLSLRAARLPSPLNFAVGMLRCPDLCWNDRFAAIRLMYFLQKRQYELGTDYSVSELLDRTRQTPLLRELIWEPLCIAALNTPAHKASAQIFANVLRDTVGASSQASDMLIPRIDLTELFPVQAARYLGMNGTVIHTATPIKRICPSRGGFCLEGSSHESVHYSHVILATAPYHASALIQEFDELTQLRKQIDDLLYEPITTIYLAYDKKISLPAPMIQLTPSIVQWLFDKGQISGEQGLLAGVISASGPHQNITQNELVTQMHQAIKTLLPEIESPRWSLVITEKRATFACHPGVIRPTCVTPVTNLLLAGDYIGAEYPATIEAAIRSGIKAAQTIIV